MYTGGWKSKMVHVTGERLQHLWAVSGSLAAVQGCLPVWPLVAMPFQVALPPPKQVRKHTSVPLLRRDMSCPCLCEITARKACAAVAVAGSARCREVWWFWPFLDFLVLDQMLNR